jgi:competence protein ComEA
VVQRGNERREVASWLVSATSQVGGLLGRLLGSTAPDQLAGFERDRHRLSQARCNPGRRTVLAMALVAAVTVILAGAWVLAARPHRVLAAVSSPTASAAGSSATTSPIGTPAAQAPLAPGGSLQSPLASSVGVPPNSAQVVVVDVVGKVRKPGVYRLPSGSRVDDAVMMAGGLQDGVDPVTVNLARKLTDGEQLLVGLVSAGASSPADAGAAVSGGAISLVDLNSATVAQLDGLPGVGPVLAQRILDWRNQHGRFDSVDQLRSVSGIGDSKFADLKALVVVG